MCKVTSFNFTTRYLGILIVENHVTKFKKITHEPLLSIWGRICKWLMLYCSYHLSEGSAKGAKSTQVIRQKCDENAANIWYKEADSITER